ncbi:hypothetical protein CYMTET_31533 [Cymbomonas tetramitiformis]|uniref:Uncharacterized protein n=1 Tax=Cymbomonas tetramitiformis TaxID=36881 RepID=A0AAE0FHB6_9CHLO|nr:hypothetical protein CYMTET_31533 [Cymbomonas tetramitiformis]
MARCLSNVHTVHRLWEQFHNQTHLDTVDAEDDVGVASDADQQRHIELAASLDEAVVETDLIQSLFPHYENSGFHGASDTGDPCDKTHASAATSLSLLVQSITALSNTRGSTLEREYRKRLCLLQECQLALQKVEEQRQANCDAVQCAAVAVSRALQQDGDVALDEGAATIAADHSSFHTQGPSSLGLYTSIFTGIAGKAHLLPPELCGVLLEALETQVAGLAPLSLYAEPRTVFSPLWRWLEAVAAESSTASPAHREKAASLLLGLAVARGILGDILQAVHFIISAAASPGEVRSLPALWTPWDLFSPPISASLPP